MKEKIKQIIKSKSIKFVPIIILIFAGGYFIGNIKLPKQPAVQTADVIFADTADQPISKKQYRIYFNIIKTAQSANSDEIAAVKKELLQAVYAEYSQLAETIRTENTENRIEDGHYSYHSDYDNENMISSSYLMDGTIIVPEKELQKTLGILNKERDVDIQDLEITY